MKPKRGFILLTTDVRSTMNTKLIKKYFNNLEVVYTLVSEEESEIIIKNWMKCYASNVKKQTGTWICDKFKWHGFSSGMQDSLSGEEANIEYKKQYLTDYYIFNENENWCFHCESKILPDLSFYGHDIYIAHHNMKWTMVYTHEHPHFGPYFATRVS